MAANDYYNAPLPDHPNQHSSAGGRLPPAPLPVSSYSAYNPQYAAHTTDSPISPNYDPKSSLYHHPGRQTSDDSDSRFYGAGGGGRGNGSGHFADDIPLQPHSQNPQLENSSLHGKQPSMDDGALPGPANRSRRKKRREPEKKGWFKGKIPWVVYIFTLIQIAVFIAEIVRNCESSHPPLFSARTDNLPQPYSPAPPSPSTRK